MSSLYSFYKNTPGLQVKRDMDFSNVTIQCDPRLVVADTPTTQTSGLFKKDTAGKLAVAHEICDLDVSNLTVTGQTALNNATVAGSLTVNGTVSNKKVVNTTFDGIETNQFVLTITAQAFAYPIGTVVTQGGNIGTLAKDYTGGLTMTVSTPYTFVQAVDVVVETTTFSVNSVVGCFCGTLSSSQSNTIFRINGGINKILYLPALSSENVGVMYDFYLTAATTANTTVKIVLPAGGNFEAVLGLAVAASNLSIDNGPGIILTFVQDSFKGSRITITCLGDNSTQSTWSAFSLSRPIVTNALT